MPTTVGLTTIEPTILTPSGIELQMLDPDAVRATERLTSRGFEAYLVGGCVRDLLLGRSPKDYDIATAARPQQVKRSFPRNCRIIGRRFKLAHLHFHNNTKILEVSTFRRTPQGVGEDGEDLLITRDNEFGNAEEDARRRDFTINALFLDPIDDRILDYADGLRDLRQNVIRTIGDPSVRFREDPVRILRATKFAGRLSFQIEPETLRAMADVAPDLVRAAPPRLLEEILRLLRGGHALDSFQLLRDIGAIRHLLPIVADFLAQAPQHKRVLFWRVLEALDQQVLEGETFTNPVLLGALFTCPVTSLAESEAKLSPSTVAEEVLGPFSQALRLPRRDAGCLKRICGVQHRFRGGGKRRFKVASFVRDPYFAEALELFELTCMARGDGFDELRRWRDLAAAELGTSTEGEPAAPQARPRGQERESAEASTANEEQAGSGGKRRRRKRRRRRDGDRESSGQRRDERPEEREERAEAGGEEREAAADADQKSTPGSRKRRRKRRRRKGQDGGQAAPSTASEPAGDGGTKPDEAAATAEEGQGSGSKRRRRRSKKSKTPSKTDAQPDAPEERQKDKQKPAAKKKARSSGKDKKGKGRGKGKTRERRGKKVEVIEPPPMDLTAFDVELDPRRVPTFGSIVENGERRKKRKRHAMIDEEGSEYKPPPPPDADDEHKPPPRDDDVFGDW